MCSSSVPLMASHLHFAKLSQCCCHPRFPFIVTLCIFHLSYSQTLCQQQLGSNCFVLSTCIRYIYLKTFFLCLKFYFELCLFSVFCYFYFSVAQECYFGHYCDPIGPKYLFFSNHSLISAFPLWALVC
jgi:hypothetical protein